jgi:DNA polymerase
MDARESLRRYLEQRRELGESELVLDTLSVDDALKLLGAASVLPRQETPVSTDWRAALMAAGGVPEARPSTPGIPVVRDVPEPEKVVVPLGDVPTGIVAGGSPRAVTDQAIYELPTLEDVAAVVGKCTRCSLYKTAKNPVPGTGNPNADFMVVGEAPGADEDEQGVPFIGRAGQLLTKILAAIELSRDDVFIANVLKHRPPGNRNPLPEEVAVCSPYLVRQIELVKPKVILALGTFAAQTLLDTKITIGKLRGQVHRYHGVPLIVTYHPAALLRNPAWKRPTWEDVQLAHRILRQ